MHVVFTDELKTTIPLNKFKIKTQTTWEDGHNKSTMTQAIKSLKYETLDMHTYRLKY